MEKPRAVSKKTTLLLFALSMHPLAHAVADTQALEFRHGLSQIPNYELKYPADFPHFNYLNADAPKGGTLVLPTGNPLNTVSPVYQPPGFYPSYDHLIERAGDEPSGYYGSLAESIALSADRRRIVFRLRRQARWHDGRPITAADVKFTVETFRADLMAHGWAGALAWVTDVNILDPLTVEIRADSDLTKQLFLIGHMPIVPAHYWLDRVLLWNYYQFPLDARGDTRIVYWDKFGRPDVPEEMYVAPFPDGWWFDQEKAARIKF